MNNDTFLIENYDIELAQELCKSIENESIRSRAVANVLGAKISEKYFTEAEIDNNSGLHNISFVQEKLEISDIYIKDNYIDVRVYFKDNELCVPKDHFDKEILPLAYMFIKLNEDISGASVTGFITPSSIDTSKDFNGYYQVNESELVSYYDIEAMISEGFTSDVDDEFLIPIFEYLNGTVEDEGNFYRILISSKYARQRLKDTLNVNNVFKYISKIEDNSECIDIDNNIEPDLDITAQEDQDIEEDFLISENTTENITELEIDNNVIDALQEEDNVYLLEADNFDLTMSSNEDLQIEPDVDSFDILNEDENNELIEITDENYEIENNLVDNDLTQELIDEPLSNNEEDNDEEHIELVDSEEAKLEWEASANLSEVSDLLLDYENTDINNNDASSVENNEETSLNDDNGYLSIEDLDNDTSSTFEFTTEVSPSINTYEETDDTTNENIEHNDEIIEDILEECRDIEVDTNNLLNETERDSSIVSNSENILATNEEEIDVLFKDITNETDEATTDEESEKDFVLDSENEDSLNVTQEKKSSKILPIIGVLALIGTIGYYASTKFMNSSNTTSTINKNSAVTSQTTIEDKIVTTKDIAMPIETVESEATLHLSEEGTTESIPAIENNLGASILISNLKVAWEVPIGYASNNTAKRYFTKLGKIIQLNLKTEMLLLSKPPISNKILVELEYDKTNQKFGVKNITQSSGEKIVDDLIHNTINNSLDINLNIDLSSLSNIQGNPTLVINL